MPLGCESRRRVVEEACDRGARAVALAEGRDRGALLNEVRVVVVAVVVLVGGIVCWRSDRARAAG